MPRPTVYKSEYCQMLIDHLEKGYSFESFAGLVGVCKQTLYNWADEHQEFLDSKKAGIEKARLFWEKEGIEGLWTIEENEGSGKDQIRRRKQINSTIWLFNMKNRFPKEWSDKKEIDHSVKDISVTISDDESDL